MEKERETQQQGELEGLLDNGETRYGLCGEGTNQLCASTDGTGVQLQRAF